MEAFHVMMDETTDDRAAGAALLEWLSTRIPDAEVGALADMLRSFRRAGFRRRREARRAFIAAFTSRLPPAERAEAGAALAWLYGERWLPPPVDALPTARPTARPLL